MNLFSGKDSEFPGLVPLIRNYLDSADVDVDTRCSISQYLSFIQVKLIKILFSKIFFCFIIIKILFLEACFRRIINFSFLDEGVY